VRRFACALLLGTAVLGACAPRPAGRAFQPINPDAAVLWDRQTTETAELLRNIADEFNRSHAGLPVKIERGGSYTDIYRKTMASLQAGKLPAMAVSYESMTAEYIAAGAAAPLDDYLRDPELGFTPEERDDFFPVMLETNRFSDFGGKMYSFPYTKSVLLMYYNKELLVQARLEAPPQTWEEFIAACRAIKTHTGRPPFAAAVDASTLNAIIFSMGGRLHEGHRTLFDAPPAIAALELYETLAREQLCYQITPGTFDDQLALAAGQAAFTLRTSSGIAYMAQNAGADGTRWAATRIPQADPARPATVLFGANVTLFNTTPEQQRSAWAFIRYFTSPEVNIRWSLGTGYLPLRRSAAQSPQMQEAWKKMPSNKAAFDCLPFALPEPNLAGWQEVRTLLERTQSEVLAGVKTGRAAALELKQKADAALARASS
jgi:ABC-type glycerol-3-phosphate transport system substrate-binding protein